MAVEKLVMAIRNSTGIQKNKVYTYVAYNSDNDMIKVNNDNGFSLWYRDSLFRPLNKTEKVLYAKN